MNGRRLYEEIGGVDERFLQQAGTYCARKKSPVWRIALIAAVLTLVGALLLCAVAAGVAIGWINSWEQGDNHAPDEETPPTCVEQMEQVMQQSQATMMPLLADEINCFDQVPTLIWSEQGSDTYYTVRLTDVECEELVNLMQSSRRPHTEQSKEPKYRIWLSFGDGVVVSPYLKNTAGNACHGSVFAYDPELELSDALARKIAQYIGT